MPAMELQGKLLIAMPGMGDMRFANSLVYLCAHSEQGAMGLIVNKPSPELSFRNLLRQLNLTPSGTARDIRVHFGGPVEHGRGFVLHTTDYNSTGTTLTVDSAFGMTATTDILEAIARGEGPEKSLLALGYAGWGAGQLEQEILYNGWLTCDADVDLVFATDNRAKWAQALAKLGVDPPALSSTAGHA